MLDKDLDQATRLIQFAELDVAKYLQDPSDYHTIEWFEGVQQALTEALALLNANPIPLLESDDE
jgi:hypothetical protein